MILLKSLSATYGDVAVNGQNQIFLLYWGNGNTGDINGSNSHGIQFKAGGTVHAQNASQGAYNHNVGTTLYYRMYMSKSGDTTRKIRSSVWTTDAYRTAEGSTGRVVNEVSTSALNSGWSSSDPLRYFILLNKNGHQANWTISNWKFWNGTASTGVANNMLSTTPTVEFTFTDVPATSNLPENTVFEQTNDYKYYFLKSGVWEAET